MSTDVVEPTEGTALPDQAVHFRHGLRRVMTLRIAGAVMLLPFIATLVMRTSGFTGMLSLVVAALGGWLIFHAQRTLAARPESVMVDGDGITVLRSGERPRVLRWREIASVHCAHVRGVIDIGTRSDPYALTIDADLTDTRAFLIAVAQRVDASRRDPVAPVARPARGTFDRALHVEITLLAVSAVGVATALLVHPAFIVITALALPALAWHWANVPQRVLVDAMAVWVVRPLARDVIPLRAISDVKFRAEGRIPTASVVIEHRDRGDIVIRGSGEAALAIFDAAVTAMTRALEAARTGTPPARAAAVDRGDFRRTALMHAGGAWLVLVAVAWLAVLSGIPLRRAAERGHTGVARAALLFPAPIGFAGADGFTALHHAASRNDVAMTRALIRRGADVQAQRGAERFAPLHTAALHGSADAATLLIAAAADVDALSARGSTPLAQAALSGASGDAAVARLLLDAGARTDITDDAGRTPIHHAALTGDAAMIWLLARARAYIEAADSAGDRALHIAARESRADALAALLESGADANAPGAHGRTALAAAAAINGAPVAIADMLLAAGARADVAGADGWNAAQLAASANNLPTLELFARRRVHLDASDGNIPPALHIAVDKGSVDAVRILLRGGASPYRAWNGRSAVDRARSAGNARMVALMQMR